MENSAKKKLVANYLENNFIHYVTNCLNAEQICKEIEKILEHELSDNVYEHINYLLWYYSVLWEKTPIDSEGATPFQEKRLDKLIESLNIEITYTIYDKFTKW